MGFVITVELQHLKIVSMDLKSSAYCGYYSVVVSTYTLWDEELEKSQSTHQFSGLILCVLYPTVIHQVMCLFLKKKRNN